MMLNLSLIIFKNNKVILPTKAVLSVFNFSGACFYDAYKNS